MSSLKVLERKVDLLIDYVTCENSKKKGHILSELLSLASQVSTQSFSGKSVRSKSMKEVTEDLLTEMGIPSNLNGYRYLTSAVCMIIESPGVALNICKGLYPEIALEHNSTPSRVERSIRHAIEVCFDRIDYEKIPKYFGGSVSPDKAEATNTEFIFRVVQLVERRMEE